MQLGSQQQPVYFPEPDQTTVLRLGLQSLDPATWIHVDGDFPRFHQHKLTMKRRHGERVFQALRESIPAQDELRDVLQQHLLGQYPNWYRLNGRVFQYWTDLTDCAGIAEQFPAETEAHSLWQSALWVPEDICILERKGEDYYLTAASVCSPSNWKLEQKIGKTLDLIHQVVPDYQQQLSGRVNRLFQSLKPDKPLLRYNWSIQSGDELCWRDDINEPVVPDSDSDSDSGRYWRVERQTLRRLPNTGAIVFTIRIYLHSLTTMAQFPAFQPHLQGILARLPLNQKVYKGL